MRAAQFIVPGPDAKPEEAGELVIFYFGSQQGGTVDANIQRWVGQFVEKGRDVKKDQGDSANGQYNLVNITGTYNKPFGPPFARQSKPAPGYQMLAITVNTSKGNYFLKLTGPVKTVSGRGRGHEKGNRYKVIVNLSAIAVDIFFGGKGERIAS